MQRRPGLHLEIAPHNGREGARHDLRDALHGVEAVQRDTDLRADSHVCVCVCVGGGGEYQDIQRFEMYICEKSFASQSSTRR